MAKRIDTFLGANTPAGFVSLFETSYDPYGSSRAFIIKGGPGTGKSTLMRRVAKQTLERGFDTECAHCGSDPGSLDAVLVPGLHLLVCDGTPPHVVEPKFPGVCENIVNLGDCWNSEALRENAGEIRRLSIENSLCHRRATRFLAAAGSLSDELRAFCAPHVLEEKLNGYALRFCSRELPKKKAAAPGVRHCRFFAGFTPEGRLFFESALRALGYRFFALHDAGTGTANRLLAYLETRATAAGYDVIVGLDPLHPKGAPQALAVPEASLSLAVFGDREAPQTPPDRTLHMRRFFEPEFLHEHKNYLAFQNGMLGTLLEQNHLLLHKAKAIHDALERHYIEAMDFGALQTVGDRLLEEIGTAK